MLRQFNRPTIIYYSVLFCCYFQGSSYLIWNKHLKFNLKFKYISKNSYVIVTMLRFEFRTGHSKIIYLWQYCQISIHQKNCNQLHSKNSWSLLLETYFHVNRFYFVKIQIFKMTMSPGVKERLEVVYEIAKTTFHWGFVPMVLYLGKQQSWNKHFLAPMFMLCIHEFVNESVI